MKRGNVKRVRSSNLALPRSGKLPPVRMELRESRGMPWVPMAQLDGYYLARRPRGGKLEMKGGMRIVPAHWPLNAPDDYKGEEGDRGATIRVAVVVAAGSL